MMRILRLTLMQNFQLFSASVEVVNRSMQVPGAARRRPLRSCLAIGRQSMKSNELHLLLQTVQNKTGTKYKVDDNIEKVFTKFINDGKATIRLKEPPHDLNIQCDVIQLKSFLHTLKLGFSKRLDPSVLSVSNLNPKNLTAAPRTRVSIKTKAEYPILQGFPRTTEELSIIGLERKSFDRQILRLQSLRVLNLSENQIASLPKELGSLPHLTELIVAKNLLGRGARNNWSWLTEGALRKTLRLLDLSGNELSQVPNQIGRITGLVTLNLHENCLSSLPQSIGILTSLMHLNVSRNRIEALPGSMKNLRLRTLDISGNPLTFTEVSSQNFIRVATLRELGGRAVINYRMPYDASTIPLTLVPYLNTALHCVCGGACIETYYRKTMAMAISRIANAVTSSGITIIPFDCVFCSVTCLRRLSKEIVM